MIGAQICYDYFNQQTENVAGSGVWVPNLDINEPAEEEEGEVKREQADVEAPALQDRVQSERDQYYAIKRMVDSVEWPSAVNGR